MLCVMFLQFISSSFQLQGEIKSLCGVYNLKMWRQFNMQTKHQDKYVNKIILSICPIFPRWGRSIFAHIGVELIVYLVLYYIIHAIVKYLISIICIHAFIPVWYDNENINVLVIIPRSLLHHTRHCQVSYHQHSHPYNYVVIIMSRSLYSFSHWRYDR